MDALTTWSGTRLDRRPGTIGLEKPGLYVFLIAVTSVYYLANGPLLLGHLDLGWHLAAGDLIRERGNVPFQDPWSFTLGDRQWYNLSWLWDVIASVMFQYTGYVGLTLSVLACGAVITGYLASICLRSSASTLAVCISVLAACLLYPAFVTAPNSYLAASPNTPTMLFCVVFYAECLKRTRWFLLPAMMVLWANLHGGFVLGLFIIGLFGAACVLKRDWAGLRIYGFAAAGCLVAILINPLGWHIYAGVTTTLGHFAQANITEWWSYSANFSVPGSIPGIVYIAIFAAFELRHPAASSAPLESRLLSWLFLLLGFYQYRYMSFFFMFATVPLALHIDRLLPKQLNDLKVQRSLLVAGIVGMCALPLTLMHVRPALAMPQLLSEQDARYLQTHFPHARLLNHWNVGGLLIFYTRGAVPVFIDGRSATAYPDELLRDYFTLSKWEVDETAWDTVLAKYKIDTVLWVKAHEPLKRFLVDKRGWTEEYAGSEEAIYVKH
ncbi:hypothetical protein [Bradyrhizobium embrapense]|uniref:hypothetical protein n=1 Tax=Bradyrhizobium embrapense TaxID=630921 RepID=UPI00067B7720|nr:hypothetical protein [Bradyrhizobium embrapense]